MGVVYYLGDHDFWNRPKRYMYCRTIETIAVIKAATEIREVRQMNIECTGTLLPYDEHKRTICDDLIPKILKVIEETGISYHEATTVPRELETPIGSNILKAMYFTKFMVQSDLE